MGAPNWDDIDRITELSAETAQSILEAYKRIRLERDEALAAEETAHNANIKLNDKLIDMRDALDTLVAKVEQIAGEIYSPRYFSGYEVESTLRIWRQAMANKLREAVSKIKRP